MTNANLLALRLRRAFRRLHDLPEEIEAEDDPAFSTAQVDYLEKRLAEVRFLFTDDQPIPENQTE